MNQEDDKDNDDRGDDEEELGMAVPDVLEDINKIGKEGLIEWHRKVLKNPPSVDAFLENRNAAKNRYPNLLLYDRTRVVLKDKNGPDYYHASWADAYDRPDGFVLAQAPFDQTTEQDFWRMCFQIKPCLMVLLTSLNGPDGQRQIKDFWPTAKTDREYCDGALKVKCTEMNQDRDIDHYDIHMTGVSHRGKNANYHFLMMNCRKWVTDRDIPDNLLEFRALMKIALARAEKECRGEGPMLFVCPTGVHRCGVLAGLDIVIDRMTVERKVGLKNTVIVLRKQRYGCFHRFETYAHVADLVVRHAVSSGIVDPNYIGSRK